MTHRATIAGRILIVAAAAGLGAAAIAGGPRWLIVVLMLALAAGFLLFALAPSERISSGIEELNRATTELERRIGVASDRLNTDTSPVGLTLAAARRIREAGDAVERRLAAAAQRDRTVQALLDGVDHPILATDAAGRILLCNAQAQELLGLRADGLVGRSVEEAFTQPDFMALIQTARGGATAREEVRVQRPDGARIWETAAVPYGDPALPRAVVMTLRDVTERSLAFQVKTDFVANASHELRTPVAAIRMAVETLEGLTPSDQAMRDKLVSMIASHTHRLEELIRDLLDLTRMESAEARVERAPLSASTLAAELTPMFEAVCRERRLTLRFDFAPELESMRSDRNLLLLVLGNLIDNACKFAFEGTEVLLTGRPGEEQRSARFEVVDEGVGIPLGQQQRIFERFFQVDAARTGGPKRGTGLGLAIVKHAVRQLGGSIRVSSVWQRGTTMTVDLPNCVESATERVGSPLPPGP